MPYSELHDLPEFKTWLITTLEPMCDADPDVLSDYIVALLKHDAVMSEDQWKEFIARELVDFLEDKAQSFVQLLFTTLSTRSFLPAPPEPTINPTFTVSAAPAPTPAIVSSYRPSVPIIPPVIPISPPTQSPVTIPNPVAGPSTFRPAPENGETQGHEEIEKDVEMVETPARPDQSQSGRQKCYDYHERGFCMRGVNCPFEHSDDVIIPTNNMIFPQFPFVPPHPGRGGGRGGPRGRGRGQSVHNGHGNGFPHSMGQPPNFPGMSPNGFTPGVPTGFPMMGMPFMPFPSLPPGEPRVSFWGSSAPPQDRTSTTLVVTDIPATSLSIQTIRNHFAQFGEITNIALEGKSSRALVSFGSNSEAYQAWKSDEAVFGSRHVKILWHRPRPGQGGVGQKALEASAGLMANMKAMEDGSAQPQGMIKASLRGPESRLAATLTELEQKEKRTRRETLMAEQKVLLKRAKDGSKEEKMAILARLKELSKEMEGLDKPKTSEENVVMSDKERLDKELEKHGMETNDQDELMRLSAQLSALRDKASTLGIPASAAARYNPYPQGRGRGRGRGRGTNNMPTRPMRLDNRTRVIVITGEQAGTSSVKEYFERTGGSVETIDGGGVKIGYPTREMAERVLAMGTKDIANLTGPISATWYNPPSENHANGQGAGHEIEMVENEARRGDHDEED